jgi:ribosome biogenesis protein BMS1
MNKSTQIVKKLKLIGTPLKIFRKTAFIQGMFSTALEASKFEGASVKSVSGIRGQIKKALRNTSVPAGSVRATFEDKILASDTIFLKSWFAIEVPKFYMAITNLLTNNSAQKQNGNASSGSDDLKLKTMAQLKLENNIKVMPNENSLYRVRLLFYF